MTSSPNLDRYTMVVQQVTLEARGVVSLRLSRPAKEPLRSWAPGAHIDIVLPSGKVRQYSLCGQLDALDSYTIAVSRAPQSRGGSVEIHETALVGRTIEVRGPRNHFPLIEADHYALIAGGIGITPILAMARQLASRGKSFRLLYGGRSRLDMPFVGEVSQLPGEVTIVAEDEHGLPNLDAFLRDAPAGAEVFCCGPEGMIRTAESVCASLQLRIRTERFVSSGRSHVAAPPSLPTRLEPESSIVASDTAFNVHLANTGVTLHVPGDRTLLEVVREHVPDVPSSCEEGFCGTCETRVLDGVPDHRDSILSENERLAGATMMICVGRAKSPTLTLDL
jgi:ferredoxin-NADP reductase